jgi:O-acetyl-ADP-ribose deacetylase (regulator of RNase III)
MSSGNTKWSKGFPRLRNKASKKTDDVPTDFRKVSIDKNVYNYLMVTQMAALKAIGFVSKLKVVIENDDMFVIGSYNEHTECAWDSFVALYENVQENMITDTVEVSQAFLEGVFINELQERFNCIVTRAPQDQTAIVVTCCSGDIDSIRQFARRDIVVDDTPVDVEESWELLSTVEEGFPPCGFDVGGIYHVYIHVSYITSLNVDALTSVVNRRLEQANGVSRVIRDRAGPEVSQLCKQIARKSGDLPVGNVVTTTAGRLQCRQIFHAVTPKWNPFYTVVKEKECSKQLRATVSNILTKFEEERISSLAIPPISSGIHVFFFLGEILVCKCLFHDSQEDENAIKI